MASKRRIMPEDQNLVPDQFPRLNRQFYETKSPPYEYLNNRLRALVLAISDSEGVRQAGESGVQIGNVKFNFGPDEADDTKGLQNFLLTESSVLLHLAAESLFRLFLAHRGSPPCPWLEVARLRDFSLFKGQIRDLSHAWKDPTIVEWLMAVFFGSSKYHSGLVSTCDEATWGEWRDGLLMLMEHLGGVLLTDSNLYNAAKHGVVAMAGQASVRFDFPEGTGVDLDTDGPAIHFLEVKGVKAERRWQVANSWVTPESNLSLVLFIVHMMTNLWKIARMRYLGMPEGGVRLLPITREYVEAGLQVGIPARPFTIIRIGTPLAYYLPPVAETTP